MRPSLRESERMFLFRFFTFALAALSIAAPADLPRMDLHAHIHDDQHPEKSLKPTDVVALSKKLGVKFGVLAEGGCTGDIKDPQSLGAFIDSLAGLPLWGGIQVYGFDWERCLTAEKLAQLDYIAADALVFPDRDGKNIRLWLKGVTFDNPQDFMDRYVAYNEKVLAQPIQIWANPTYLPDTLHSSYDELWTPARMDRVIGVVVKNHIAIEINAKFEIPSAAFIKRAKAAGAKFSIGSNQHVHGIGEIDFCLRRARECGLTSADFFIPKRQF